jgi:hypothetical protein
MGDEPAPTPSYAPRNCSRGPLHQALAHHFRPTTHGVYVAQEASEPGEKATGGTQATAPAWHIIQTPI